MRLHKIWLIPVGLAISTRDAKYIRLNALGLEIGLCFPCEWWSGGFSIAIFGYGISFDKSTGFWLTQECIDDFWLPNRES